MKLTADELLRKACLYAEFDREGFIDAYRADTREECVRDAMDFLKQLKAYRIKRWGKTKMEALIADPNVKMLGLKEMKHLTEEPK